MRGNSFGEVFRITTFGESHGAAIGGVIDGCPAGLDIDETFIRNELDRRRPGQSAISTQRMESDDFEILSGVYEGVSTGTPLAFVVRNTDAKSKDYQHLQQAFRPSHADYTYAEKYGIRDYRGGGRSSARETVSRVFSGAVAKLLLNRNEIQVSGYTSQIGKVILEKLYLELDLGRVESNAVRCPDPEIADRMIKEVKDAQAAGDTLGGIISCVIKNVPVGLGEPVFDKLHADLAKAMMSINAVKGFEIGSGFSAVVMKGSEHNDEFYLEKEKVRTKTNHSGGIQGGISNGEDIYFRVAFKPVATVMKSQPSIDEKGNKVMLEGKGRHDPCVVPRAVVIVEAMAAIVIADHLLRNKTVRID